MNEKLLEAIKTKKDDYENEYVLMRLEFIKNLDRYSNTYTSDAETLADLIALSKVIEVLDDLISEFEE